MDVYANHVSHSLIGMRGSPIPVELTVGVTVSIIVQVTVIIVQIVVISLLVKKKLSKYLYHTHILLN